MKNQQKLWDELHDQGRIDHFKNKPTDFAQEVEDMILSKSYILDLGCGVGNDSYYFAQNGHQVLATDFSEVAIVNNRKNFKLSNLEFGVLDISKPMLFADQTFDVVYARLSLHYFSNKVTKKVFKDIARVLKTGGLVCFICKSIKDPKYGQGIEIEKDMFDKDGHIRHFFSENYAKKCLNNMFKIKIIKSGEDIFYEERSAYIQVIAVKK